MRPSNEIQSDWAFFAPMICVITLAIAAAIAAMMLPAHARQMEILDGERNVLPPQHID